MPQVSFLFANYTNKWPVRLYAIVHTLRSYRRIFKEIQSSVNGYVLTDIEPDNPAFREEYFGPVALMFRVKEEDEAVALANDSDYGLGRSVFTQDVARGQRLASRIETGMVFINYPTWTASYLPFGGIKNSGYGRELSRLGIQEFVNKKLMRTQTIDAPA